VSEWRVVKVVLYKKERVVSARGGEEEEGRKERREKRGEERKGMERVKRRMRAQSTDEKDLISRAWGACTQK